ncbi:hypothetical protein SESBI_19646 [Sesbania bispinosa]|nr:hypothetical protein SESBI_19646 [Sesbania bispinosa]
MKWSHTILDRLKKHQRQQHKKMKRAAAATRLKRRLRILLLDIKYPSRQRLGKRTQGEQSELGSTRSKHAKRLFILARRNILPQDLTGKEKYPPLRLDWKGEISSLEACLKKNVASKACTRKQTDSDDSC